MPLCCMVISLLGFGHSRDGLHESNVVTKTFVVEDAGPPPDDLESILSENSIESVDTFVDKPSNRYGLSKSQLGLAKKKVSLNVINFLRYIQCYSATQCFFFP